MHVNGRMAEKLHDFLLGKKGEMGKQRDLEVVAAYLFPSPSMFC